MWRLVGLGLVLTGCAAPRPTDEYFANYDRAIYLERSRQYEAAADAYAKTADVATRPRTRDFAAYRQARQLELAGRRDEARRLYLEIAHNNPGGEMASRCVYYAGRMAFEDGDLETGLTYMRRVMEEYHHKGLAPQAVRRSVQNIIKHRGPEQALEFLRAQEERLRGTDVGDRLLYEMARIHEDQGRWEQAIEHYDRMDELYRYPHSGLWDDAMYKAGQLALKHGAPKRALGYFEAIVAWREASAYTGSHYTDVTDDSQLMIGRIHLEHFDDPAAAARAFEDLVDFLDSALADDGLWWASRAYLKQGKTRRSCKALRRLLKEFPYSNQQRKARQAYRDEGC